MAFLMWKVIKVGRTYSFSSTKLCQRRCRRRGEDTQAKLSIILRIRSIWLLNTNLCWKRFTSHIKCPCHRSFHLFVNLVDTADVSNNSSSITVSSSLPLEYFRLSMYSYCGFSEKTKTKKQLPLLKQQQQQQKNRQVLTTENEKNNVNFAIR